LRPLFSEVRWDEQAECYVRRYRIAYVSMARKCGKSELAAGIALYLLVADGEEGAEIYGAASDRDQARKVFDVAARMVQLSPVLSRRLVVKAHAKRIVDEQTGSYYEVIASDAAGNLGHNPHGYIHDELLTAPDSSLWDAMRTGAGTRTQPLMLAITTAGNDRDSFAYSEYVEAKKVIENPKRSPHRFAYIAELPADADPWDESRWVEAAPALGDFLSLQTLREEAAEARENAAQENSFRQYRLNQWVSQVTRWIPMDLYDGSTGEVWPSPDWRVPHGRPLAFGGLDLSARLDLTSWAVLVPRPDGTADISWRHWLPEAALPALVQTTAGAAEAWMRDGWLTVTEGDVIDYQQVYADIADDAAAVTLAEVGYDPWSGEPAVQELAARIGPSVELVPVSQTFAGLSPGMNELMAVLKTKALLHHANPVARFCFDAVEVKRGHDDPELIKPVKPRRGGKSKRIDAVLTAAMAVAAWRTRARKPRSGRVVGF
jgi:phage terminase large subunit-like protein